MLDLVDSELATPPAQVVDPGAGVGAFTIAAAKRWTGAHIVAVDVNVVTLGLLAARIAFEADADPDQAWTMNRIELVHADYLDRLPQTYQTSESGPIVSLGNPPYTRAQALTRAARARAAELAGDVLDSGHANLAMLFQAATLRHMRPQDVSCMVLPGSFSYTRASLVLRRTLWESRRSVRVERTPAATRAFIGRSVQAAVLLVGAERARRPPLRLARIRVGDHSVDVIESWMQSRASPSPTNWFWTAEDDAPADDTVPLASVASIRRGVATGANRVFFLTDSQAAALAADVVIRGVPSLRRFDGRDLDQAAHDALGGPTAQRWLLAVPPHHVVDGALRAYLDAHTDVRRRYLASKRQPWYAITELPTETCGSPRGMQRPTGGSSRTKSRETGPTGSVAGTSLPSSRTSCMSFGMATPASASSCTSVCYSDHGAS
jgi:hypothetical protein